MGSSMTNEESENQDIFSITDLSKEFNISTRTIRFYESKGLLAPNRVGGTRIFYRRDRARLILILRGKRLGFSLKEIEEYLSLYDADKGNKVQVERLHELVNQRLEKLNGQMQDIKTTISELSELKELTKTGLAG